MDRDRFVLLMDNEFQDLLRTGATKGKDYAGDDDALSNFKRHAAELGLTPEQVWAVYASKHWDAIMTYVRLGHVASEPVEGRIHDAIMYLFLLLGLVIEHKEFH